jgi:hypothetical protein
MASAPIDLYRQSAGMPIDTRPSALQAVARVLCSACSVRAMFGTEACFREFLNPRLATNEALNKAK